jgi:hypothetical protein
MAVPRTIRGLRGELWNPRETFLVDLRKLPVFLQVQPETGGCSQGTGKFVSHLGTDATLLAADLVYDLGEHANVKSQATLSNTALLELVFENRTWMNC